MSCTVFFWNQNPRIWRPCCILKNCLKNIKDFCPNIITPTFVISVIYALSTILMMVPTEFHLSHVLIIPYMVLQLFSIKIMINNSIFQNLTLVFMSQYSSFSSLAHFNFIILFILLVLTSLGTIYNMNKTWTHTGDSDMKNVLVQKLHLLNGIMT